jgi:secondary thiamine-phosphate synthase enzyme
MSAIADQPPGGRLTTSIGKFTRQPSNMCCQTMLYEFALSAQREDFYNITPQVREAVAKSGVESGVVTVYCPHTTAGITINENADPDVVHDLLIGLRGAFPDRSEFRHGEGNSAAHLKASVIGSNVTVIIESGKLLLGTWQGVYFCEFDPPRNRQFYVKVQGE